MSNNETTGGWPCPPEYRDIKVIVIAKVMNKCKITFEEYMKDRKKYLTMCGVIKEVQEE